MGCYLQGQVVASEAEEGDFVRGNASDPQGTSLPGEGDCSGPGPGSCLGFAEVRQCSCRCVVMSELHGVGCGGSGYLLSSDCSLHAVAL